MLLLCVWLKLFRCRFVPLVEPNPGDATAPRSYVQLLYRPDYSHWPIRTVKSSGSKSHPPSKNPISANESQQWSARHLAFFSHTNPWCHAFTVLVPSGEQPVNERVMNHKLKKPAVKTVEIRPDSSCDDVVEATSVNQFKNRLDKFWRRWALKGWLNQPVIRQLQVQVHSIFVSHFVFMPRRLTDITRDKTDQSDSWKVGQHARECANYTFKYVYTIA